mmetsp:Transcript_20958/g.40084  ORF Transcript_20958/g.40084 Transcript_20958/m.40084 type:complete len:216 (-) Transcript_20958:318-965(-)
MHIELLEGQTKPLHKALALQGSPVVPCCCSREVSATTSHDLVNNKHARVCAMLVHDVVEKLGPFLCRSPCTQCLADREHIVVDGFWHANHRELVVVFRQEGCQISSRSVGVIATNRVQHVHVVPHELVCCDFLRILPFFDKPTLYAVFHICQLNTTVSNRATTMLVTHTGHLPNLWRDLKALTQKQTLIPTNIADDGNPRVQLRVSLDKVTHSRR